LARSGKRSISSQPAAELPVAAGPAHLRPLIAGLTGELRERCFTHPSFVEDRSLSYERLEFLGDSVLDLAIAQELYDLYPDFSEGRLTKAWAYVVSRPSCAEVGEQLGLGELLAVGRGAPQGPELRRLVANRNVLAALIEALLGALYLQHGFEPIRLAIVNAFAERIEYAITVHVDFKTELQEEAARLGLQVVYRVVAAEGPPHERSFTCAAVIDGQDLGVGHGPSKKAAEQAAAREALEALTTR
jgi:ribonuclease-3